MSGGLVSGLAIVMGLDLGHRLRISADFGVGMQARRGFLLLLLLLDRIDSRQRYKDFVSHVYSYSMFCC